MILELEQLTRDYFEDDQHSHLDYAVAQIESGVPIAGIARNLAEKTGLDIQRHVLSRYLHDLSPDAAQRIAEARPIMAHAMAEDALTIVDEHVSDKLDIARNALRARTREGLAKMFNPEFQQNKQQGVTLNIGTLHLNALKAVNLMNSMNSADDSASGVRLTPARSIEPVDALVASVDGASGASDNGEQEAQVA